MPKSANFSWDPDEDPTKTLARARKLLADGKIEKSDFETIEKRLKAPKPVLRG